MIYVFIVAILIIVAYIIIGLTCGFAFNCLAKNDDSNKNNQGGNTNESSSSSQPASLRFLQGLNLNNIPKLN
jgi:uncharacterized membrane protein SpoIIM required for sporulation